MTDTATTGTHAASGPRTLADWLRSLAWLLFGSYLVGLVTTRFYETIWQYPQVAATPVLDLSQIIYGSVFTFTVGFILWAAFALNVTASGRALLRTTLFVVGQVLGLAAIVFLVQGFPYRDFHTVLLVQFVAVQLVMDVSIFWSSRRPHPEGPSPASDVLAELVALPPALRDQLHNAIAGSFIVVALAILNYSCVPQTFGGAAPLPVQMVTTGNQLQSLRPPLYLLGRRGSFLLLSDSAKLAGTLERPILLILESAVVTIATPHQSLR